MRRYSTPPHIGRCSHDVGIITPHLPVQLRNALPCPVAGSQTTNGIRWHTRNSDHRRLITCSCTVIYRPVITRYTVPVLPVH
nr:MAG TPA: hypothetical protein [Bacteriophage sp.]